MIQHRDSDYEYEELTLAEFAKRFANKPSTEDPSVTDLEGDGIQILTEDVDGNQYYEDILAFLVKPSVSHYYTDGQIKVAEGHTFIEGGVEVRAEDHPAFSRVDKPMEVVDVEVGGSHTYLANGRLNHNTTSGGKALGFHASVRVRLKGLGKIKSGKDKTEQIVGVQTEANVIKNRVGPPFRKAAFDIYFNSGIDDATSWLTSLKDYGVIKQAGAHYTLVAEDTGEVITFMAKDWKSVLERPEIEKYCYDKLCEIFIMKYRSQDLVDPSEITVDDEAY